MTDLLYDRAADTSAFLGLNFLLCVMESKGADLVLPQHINKMRKNRINYSLVSQRIVLKSCYRGFPGGTVVKDPPSKAADTGSSPGPGRSHVPQSS